MYKKPYKNIDADMDSDFEAPRVELLFFDLDVMEAMLLLSPDENDLDAGIDTGEIWDQSPASEGILDSELDEAILSAQRRRVLP